MKTLLGKFVTLVLVSVLAVGVVLGAGRLGWLEVFGIESESRDTQVIKSIERTQEVSLLSLAVQGIKEKKESGKVAGWGIPGVWKATFLQYSFDAKLGIDGQRVKVIRAGDNAYRVTVPEFIFIGHADPEFKVAVEDGGALGWATQDIDEVEMVNEILNDDARDTYVEENEELLQDQTKVFYDSLITGIDPSAKITYEFTS